MLWKEKYLVNTFLYINFVNKAGNFVFQFTFFLYTSISFVEIFLDSLLNVYYELKIIRKYMLYTYTCKWWKAHKLFVSTGAAVS